MRPTSKACLCPTLTSPHLTLLFILFFIFAGRRRRGRRHSAAGRRDPPRNLQAGHGVVQEAKGLLQADRAPRGRHHHLRRACVACVRACASPPLNRNKIRSPHASRSRIVPYRTVREQSGLGVGEGFWGTIPTARPTRVGSKPSPGYIVDGARRTIESSLKGAANHWMVDEGGLVSFLSWTWPVQWPTFGVFFDLGVVSQLSCRVTAVGGTLNQVSVSRPYSVFLANAGRPKGCRPGADKASSSGGTVFFGDRKGKSTPLNGGGGGRQFLRFVCTPSFQAHDRAVVVV